MTALERIVFAVLVLAVAAGGYWWWRSQQTPAPPPPPPAVAPAATPTAPPVADAEPSVQHPIEQAPVGSESEKPKPLPKLAESDAAATEALASVFNGKVPDLFVPKNLIRQIVATVDNLPRDKVAMKLWPVKPASGLMIVANTRDGKAIAPENSARYAPYVRLMEAVDAKKVAAVYVRFYPLFQEAYRDLGYPKGYFNDRLIVVIDHLLATPEVHGQIRLEQPKVLYEFADPMLKAASSGQQILLRMGPENSQKVKAKLRELRKEVARQNPKG
jgi:hypothetical protein